MSGRGDFHEYIEAQSVDVGHDVEQARDRRRGQELVTALRDRASIVNLRLSAADEIERLLAYIRELEGALDERPAGQSWSWGAMIIINEDREIDPQHVESLSWSRVRGQRDELIVRMVSGVELDIPVKGGDADKVYDLIMKAKQGSRS